MFSSLNSGMTSFIFVCRVGRFWIPPSCCLQTDGSSHGTKSPLIQTSPKQQCLKYGSALTSARRCRACSAAAAGSALTSARRCRECSAAAGSVLTSARRCRACLAAAAGRAAHSPLFGGVARVQRRRVAHSPLLGGVARVQRRRQVGQQRARRVVSEDLVLAEEERRLEEGELRRRAHDAVERSAGGGAVR